MISYEGLRKSAVFVACLFFASLTLQAETQNQEWRTWVSPDGAEIEAYLKEVLPEGIVIVRHDGREFTAPLERFSEADRKYVTAWVQAKLPSAVDFRALDFNQVELPASYEVSGVEHARPGSGEPS